PGSSRTAARSRSWPSLMLAVRSYRRCPPTPSGAPLTRCAGPSNWPTEAPARAMRPTATAATPITATPGHTLSDLRTYRAVPDLGAGAVRPAAQAVERWLRPQRLEYMPL